MRRPEMRGEDEAKDERVERREASEPPAAEAAPNVDVDDDDVVDAHVWRAQT